MFNVGKYTFAPWKVVWGRLGNRLEAAVVARDILPQETITLIPSSSEAEAHYLAATVNSLPFQFAAYAYSQAGGKSFGSPHLLENIHIPRFDPQGSVHQELVQLSREAHRMAVAEDEKGLKAVQEGIDSTAARLWGLTKDELTDVRLSLAELQWKPE
jgi:hypothetical protein